MSAAKPARMPNKTPTLLFAATLTLLATPAFAATDPENPTNDPTKVVTVRPAAPSPASADPNIDRGFVLPTAMTQPRGSLTYNNYELLLHGLTYGITDNVQTSLTVLSPIVRDMPVVAFGAIKGRLAVTDRLHLALQGSFGYLHVSSDSESETAYSMGAGTFASVCLRDDCSSLLSASATYQLAVAGNSEGRTQAIIYGGSIVHRVHPRIKLLGELTSAVGKESAGGFTQAPALLASYGVRFHTGNIAGDIGFVKPISTEDDDDFDELLLGLPFVNVSYRWQ
jgi:hypothetical protein